MDNLIGQMVDLALENCHGTVKDFPNFDAEEDAQVLRKAMKGLGTDEKAIINVLGYRSSRQRQALKNAYKQSFGRDLIKDLKSEISGNFEDLVVALMQTPAKYDVDCLHHAMKGVGTTESTLIDILATRSNAQLKEIRELYKKEHKNELEKALISETSGDFQKLLVSLNNACRDETNNVDQAKAEKDANTLYQAGEKKLGTDEAKFNMILCTRNFAQLRATFNEYAKLSKKDILKVIGSEFSGDIEDGLKAIICIARSAAGYFAMRINQSIKGAGTKDAALIRLVVTRSEFDMVEVKEAYAAMYKKSLAKDIAGDTSGDYKKLLLALVGN